MASDVPAYTDTTWVEGAAPGIAAAQLNRIDDQVKALSDEFNVHNGGVLLSDHPVATPSVRGFMSSADKTKLNGSFGLVRVRRAALVTILDTTLTTLVWDVEDRDDWGGHPTNEDEINDDAAGIYIAEFNVVWVQNSTGIRQVQIQHGGVVKAVDRDTTTIGDTHAHQVTLLVHSDGSEQFFAQVFQTSGGSLDIQADQATHFSVAKLGST